MNIPIQKVTYDQLLDVLNLAELRYGSRIMTMPECIAISSVQMHRKMVLHLDNYKQGLITNIELSNGLVTELQIHTVELEKRS